MAVNLSDEATAQNRAWQRYVKQIRAGEGGSFDDQWARFEEIFRGRSAEDGPPPVWQPTPHDQTSNLGEFMNELGFRSYAELHRWSVTDRAAFWGKVIKRLAVVFSRPPDRILDLTSGVKDPRWLAGVELNIVDSCFKASDDKPALISASETAPREIVTTYGELERLVNRIANGLHEHGFSPGDTIALYMPMTLECVAMYLAVVRAGLRVASIADSFAPPEVAKRCEITNAQCVITVDAYQRAGRTIRLYEKVQQAGVPRAIVVSKAEEQPALREGDITLDALLSQREDFDSVVSHPDDTMNVLFSSGTTSTPQGGSLDASQPHQVCHGRTFSSGHSR